MKIIPAPQRRAVVVIAGPTATGKTALALKLAEQFNGEIVSADSALVYRGLDIGSAKPTRAEQARVPHHLIDVRPPTEPYSAALFAVDAATAIDDIHARVRLPIIAGGTFLYLRALLAGLSAMPQSSPALRAQIQDEAARVGWPTMHARLAERDPAAAARIAPTDPQRIGRALEVIEIAGKPLSQLQHGVCRRPAWRTLKIALLPTQRRLLDGRIAARIEAMLGAGFVDEARQLHASAGFAADLPAFRSVGYAQAFAMLEGPLEAAALAEQIGVATRHLAKRQMTWLRREFEYLPRDPLAAGLEAKVCEDVDRFLVASG